jgi:hypothetical protein
MDDELERIWKGAVVALFMVLLLFFLAWRDRGKPQKPVRITSLQVKI